MNNKTILKRLGFMVETKFETVPEVLKNLDKKISLGYSNYDPLLNCDSIVEKNYVLGWLLHGINNHPKTQSWIFKGGTSLKKCFFETFRFSEDLDFTIRQKDMLTVEELNSTFIEVAEFSPEKFRFKIIDKDDGKCSAQGVLHYTRPLQMKHNTTS